MTKYDVIIIDDDEVDRYVLLRFLAKNTNIGKISEFSSGHEFIEKSSSIFANISDKYIVLVDINLPMTSGFETLEKFEVLIDAGKIPNGHTIMMCTSSNNPYDRKKSEDISMIKGYIVKPITKDKISEMIRICDTLTE
ncbi:MAG: response regulator [Rhizobiaceae bacterium]|nr:response regulator [Rhizobiaceae bacterium]